jgi:DNA-binding CsgD family transcriptional regulator
MEIIVYLRAGMSSKEIAMIMGLQTKTVEVHRSNIRKVLGLDPAENINTFLQRI